MPAGSSYEVVCESDTLQLSGTPLDSDIARAGWARLLSGTPLESEIARGGWDRPLEITMTKQKFISLDEHVENLYGWEAEEEDAEALPAGFCVIADGGGWAAGDDGQLAAFMSAKSEKLTLEDLKDEDTLAKFPRISNRPHEHIIARSVVLSRISKMLMACLPLVDFEGSDALGTSQVKELRTLILKQDKTGLVTRVLKLLKKTEIRRPSIKIDRTKARWDSESDPTGERSIFGQIYTSLGENATSPTIFRGADRWWTVTFTNEHVSDAGGGFRETVSNISDDLNSTRTPLFIPVPNATSEVGDIRDSWMPSPGCTNYAQYEFVGRLMAAAIQSDESIVLQFPPFVWKKIARFPVDSAEYIRSIDAYLSSYDAMLTMDDETFEFSFDELMFEAHLSDGSCRELMPGGSTTAVTTANRAEYVERVVAARLGEIDRQCEALRRGLLSACIRASC